MNVKQLERIRDMIGNIGAELETDSSGISDIREANNKLYQVVISELKNELWNEYLTKEVKE